MTDDTNDLLSLLTPLTQTDGRILSADADADAVGTSLDSQETSVHRDYDSSHRTFATSGIRKLVEHVEAAYRHADGLTGDHHVINYVQCRSMAWFIRHVRTGQVKLASSKCGLRWCPLCSQVRRFTIQRSVAEWLKTLEKPKFLTLTLKHSNASLQSQIDNLYKSFQKLRRGKLWKKHVKGGIWFFQIKKSKTDGLWHPHLHVLIKADYLPQAELSAAWASVTHGSKIVDIRLVKDQKKAADYVARYAAAPAYLPELSVEDAAEVIIACHGRRIVGTFGAGKDIKLTAKPLEEPGQWENIGFWNEVCHRRHIDPESKAVFVAWLNDTPYHGPGVRPKPPQFMDANEVEAEVLTYKQLAFCWKGCL